jgi:hypothetical protein
VLVGIGYPLVILLAKFVFVGVRVRIAAAPELFNKAFAFLVRLELFEGLTLFVCDDVGDVLVEPIFVGLL